jgi:hypothetical protein
MHIEKEKLRKIPHFFSAFLTLLHAYERYEHGHQTFILFLIAGLVFLIVALFHHKLLHRFPLIDLIFFTLEGLLAFVISAELIYAGKKGLPVMYVIAGVFQIIAAYRYRLKMQREKK